MTTAFPRSIRAAPSRSSLAALRAASSSASSRRRALSEERRRSTNALAGWRCDESNPQAGSTHISERSLDIWRPLSHSLGPGAMVRHPVLRVVAALRSAEELLRPSPLRPKPPPASEASASGAPRQTQPRPTGRQAPAPRPGNIQHALQHAGKSSLEPAFGTIIVLIGVVGLAIAGYFFALAGDRSNSSITKSATVDSSPSATPRINVNTAAGSPKKACIKSVQASPSYSLPAGAAFTYTRNVLTTKSGLTQWSVSGLAEANGATRANVKFDCTIEKTPTGSWSVSYTIAP